MEAFPLAPLKIVVLISGGGTTLKNLLAQIDQRKLDARVLRVISSNPTAGGLLFATDAGIPTNVVRRKDFPDVAAFSRAMFELARADQAHLVVMGGFLKQVEIADDFTGRVVNIHPALIPAFCGQGFYGHHVHQAALNYGVKISGCTVHFVDNHFDQGPVILQVPVPVHDDDTPQTLAARVFAAECQAYPRALRLYAAGRLTIDGRRVRVAPSLTSE